MIARAATVVVAGANAAVAGFGQTFRRLACLADIVSGGRYRSCRPTYGDFDQPSNGSRGADQLTFITCPKSVRVFVAHPGCHIVLGFWAVLH